MLNQKALNEEIELTQGLKSLVETYEAIAASSMRRIRVSVLENRAFHLGLNRLFQEVKEAYYGKMRRLTEIRGAKLAGAPSLIQRNKKTVLIFLSANTGLYGDIINRTFDLFKKEVLRDPKADVIVVGKIGKALAEEGLPEKKIQYFDFPDTHLALESLKEITQKASSYEKVTALHGVFKSFVEQKPVSSNISGDALSEEAPSEKVAYLFEPSLEKVVIFFETEIFASLLEQVFHESRLAKLASRIMLLDRASQNIEKTFEKLSLVEQRSRHLVFNKKQLDAISGLALWGQ